MSDAHFNAMKASREQRQRDYAAAKRAHGSDNVATCAAYGAAMRKADVAHFTRVVVSAREQGSLAGLDDALGALRTMGAPIP